MKDSVLGDKDAALFEEAKNVKYMQNFATKMKLGNGANELDVTNAHNCRTRLILIVRLQKNTSMLSHEENMRSIFWKQFQQISRRT